MRVVSENLDQFELLTDSPLTSGLPVALRFIFIPEDPRLPGTRLWLFMDIRQDPGIPQATNAEQPDFISVQAGRTMIKSKVTSIRTLDLFPRLPEFLYSCEFCFEKGLKAHEMVTIQLGVLHAGWRAPNHPISAFHFWFLVGETDRLALNPTGYKTYHAFNSDYPERLQERIVEFPIEVEGCLSTPGPDCTRKTPGILWGDIHGMSFNQRPLDDYYHYARDIARMDFAAAMLFGYNICVSDTWSIVKAAAKRWNVPGHFLAIAGFETATPPDGSHRNAYFFDAEAVPPIFCEDRPPARDPRLTRRFHPDTLFCNDLASYYQAVSRYGGIVTGHFHTLDYQEEILAEIWQKQVGNEGDEDHIFDLLNQGFVFGIVGGSDTHDSMPGNQSPEPYCPQTAGQMAVLSKEISTSALRMAIDQRQVYATTGARIVLDFSCGQASMGSILPNLTRRELKTHVEGTAPLAKVDIIRNGELVHSIESGDKTWIDELWIDNEPTTQKRDWYLLRVTQSDGHRAWSSPIWFGKLKGSPK